MPVAIHAYRFDGEGEPVVEYVVYGEDESDAEEKLAEHVPEDSYTLSVVEEIDEVDMPRESDFEDDFDDDEEDDDEDQGAAA